MKKRILLMCCALSIAMLMFAGCGQTSSDEKKTTKETTTEASETTTEETKDDKIDGLGDLYAYIGENYDSMPYTISPKAQTFLNDHPEVCPTKKIKKIKKYIDMSVEYKKVAKNQDNFGDKIMRISEAYVIKAQESKTNDGSIITEIQVNDAKGNNYNIMYMDGIDVYEDDTICIYGVPLGMTSFENVGGGTTISLVMAGSYIKKIN